MIGNCPIPGTGSGFLSGSLYFIDCATQEVAGGGYRALASSVSSGGTVLGALLVLFVATYGVRLLAGHTPSARDLLFVIIKIGAVLTLAGSWDAYRVLVQDVVLLAPAEIVADMAQAVGLGGGDLIGRLQMLDQGILTLTRLGSGFLDVGSVQDAGAAADIARAPVADGTAMAAARIIYLTAVIAVFGIIRLLTGVLLALGPLFAGLLLFEATRSLFMGWAKTLFGSLIGAVAVTSVLELQLALMLPWLNGVLTQRLARVATPAAPIELLVLVAAFAVILTIGLQLIWRLVLAPGIASVTSQFSLPDIRALTSSAALSPATANATASSSSASWSAPQLAGASGGERPGAVMSAAQFGASGSRVPEPETSPAQPPVPLGQSYRRKIGALSAGRRQGARLR